MLNIKKTIISAFLLIAILVQSFSVGILHVGATEEGYKGELRWDFIDGAEGYAVYRDNGTVSVSQGDDALNVNITTIASGKNAGIQYNQEFEIDRRYHDYIIFQADLPADISKISAYLYDSTQSNYKFGWGNNDNSIQAGITSGSNIYAFKLNEAHIASGKPDTEVTDGTYNKFELRFMTSAALSEETISIDWVAFSKYNYGAIMCNGINASSSVIGDLEQPSIIESISITEDEVINLPTTEAYSVSEVYSSTYQDLDELLNVADVVYADEYTDTSFSYRITEKAGYKLLDITATGVKDLEEITRSYRTKITLKPDPAPNIIINECTYRDKTLAFSGNMINGRGDDYVRNALVLVMAYCKENGIGTNGENLTVWTTVTTDENGDFSGSIMIRDYETASQLYTMEVLFCSADAIASSEVTYYNDKCVESLTMDMATKTDGMFAFMTDGLNQPIFESMGVSLQKYESYDRSEQTIINDNTKKNQSEVTVENIVEIANGTLLSYAAKKASGDAMLVSILDDFDQNVMALQLRGDDSDSFSELSSSRKRTIVNHFQNSIKPADYDDWFQFKNSIQASMLLEYISTQRSSAAVKKAILDNKDIIVFGKSAGSSDVLKKLEAEKKKAPDDAVTYLLNQQKGTMFKDTAELLTAIEKALKETEGSNDGGSGSGSGSSSGGRSGSGNTSITVSVEKKANDNENETDGNPPAKNPYTDLGNYEWAADAISRLSELGIVNGVGNGLFEPSREVTREEFTKLLCEAFDLDGSVEISFTDVPKDAWYREYVSCAVKNGVVNGISDDTFGSGQRITREDMAVLIFRAFKALNKDIHSESMRFNDYDEIAEYAQEAVGQLAGAGIVNGVGNGNFSPKVSASRAEATVIIYRCIERFGR